MALVEYLYVDEKRLDIYFEQISSPVTYDKVPEWNANISLIGPKAGGKQARFARAYSTHEKISKLTKYLEDEGLVGYGRADTFITDKNQTFRLETYQAKRVFIPFIPTKPHDSSLGGLNLWISLVDLNPEQSYPPSYPPQPGALYLLEDYRGDRDADPLEGHDSGFSLLNLLLHGSLSQLNLGASRYDDLPDLDLSGASDDRELRRFSVDPTVALSQLGARVGPAREIRSLYRIRATFVDRDSEPDDSEPEASSLATFGYPIFVAEGTDTV